jgi:hypothetical protein
MLNILSGVLLPAVWGVAFIALVGVPIAILVWELRRGRTLPPFRIERATRPGWYWTCMVAHMAFVPFMLLVYAFFFLAWVIVPEISN